MRIARTLAALALAAVAVTACVAPPPPPPPPFALGHLNGFFVGTGSLNSNPSCQEFAREDFDAEYTNAVGPIQLFMGGCVTIQNDGTFRYDGFFRLTTADGGVNGTAAGSVEPNFQTLSAAHELVLTVRSGSGGFENVRGRMRAHIDCSCGFAAPSGPASGGLAALR